MRFGRSHYAELICDGLIFARDLTKLAQILGHTGLQAGTGTVCVVSVDLPGARVKERDNDFGLRKPGASRREGTCVS